MLIFTLIFVILIIIYFHLLFHWKVSNDIDIPHISLPDKKTLEQVGDLRQPFLFEKDLPNSFVMNGLDYDVNIYNEDTHFKVPHKAMVSAIKKEKYLSFNNGDFLDKANWLADEKIWGDLDYYLRPPLMLQSKYDIIYGNQGSYTKTTCSMNYRNYFYVLYDDIEVKLCTPDSKNNIDDSFNLWDQSTYSNHNNNNVNVIHLTVKAGSILHIPAYWYYSIRFPKTACVLSLSYVTFTNALSMIPIKISNYMKKNKIEF